MIKENDFLLREGEENGYTILKEISCGFAPYLLQNNAYWMISKTGDVASFSFPKGHVQIMNGYPETMIETAERETREEMFLEDFIQLEFNGFIGSLKEKIRFDNSKEISFKTINYFGANLEIPNPNYTLANGRIVRAISLNDDLKYVKPELSQVVDAYISFLRNQG